MFLTPSIGPIPEFPQLVQANVRHDRYPHNCGRAHWLHRDLEAPFGTGPVYAVERLSLLVESYQLVSAWSMQKVEEVQNGERFGSAENIGPSAGKLSTPQGMRR